MPRLIELRSGDVMPTNLEVDVGDILLVDASGGRVGPDSEAVLLRGILSRGVIAGDGRVLAPEGPPNIVMLQAVRPGAADVELMLGDPFGAPQRAMLCIKVRDTGSTT